MIRQLSQVNLTANQLQALPQPLLEASKHVQILLCANPVAAAPQGHSECGHFGSRFTAANCSFDVGLAEYLGRRPTQEDAFLLCGGFMGRPDVDLYGIFDGHSGHTASRFCAEHFPDCLEALWDENNLQKALVDSLKLVNERLRSHIENEGGDDRCGSTAVVALFIKTRLYVANLGDSRAVLCDAGKATPMSEDHKPSRDADRVRQLGGYISGVTGKGDTERINGQLAVARGLGDFYMQPFLSDEAEVAATDLRPSHQFLILACDGVWDEVDNQDACDVVLAEQSPWRGSSRLISFAYQAGSDDNISAIVIDLRRTGLASGPQAVTKTAPKKSGSFLKSLKDLPPKKLAGSPPPAGAVPLKRVPVGGTTTKKVPVGRAKVPPPAKTPPPGIKDPKKVPVRPPPGKLVPKTGLKPIPKLTS